MTRHARSVAVALLLMAVPVSLAAQRLADAPTYFATVLTPVGALPPLATPAQLGMPRLVGVGLDVLYGYGKMSALQQLSLHTVGAAVELALFRGFLSVSGTGAYMIPDCGAAAVHCAEYPMGGAAATLRVARWSSVDPLSEGYVTLALHAEAGMGFPRGGRARSAAAGPSVTFVGTRGTLRVIAFVTPEAVWGRLKVDDPARFDRQFGSVFALGDSTFEESGVRFMTGGGLALVSTRTGLGLHVGVQHVLIHGSRPRVGASVSWRSSGAW